MYEHLRGTLAGRHPTRAVVDVGGIGFDLLIPLSTFEKLPPTGEPILVYTHLHVRDDSQKLFGFATLDERRFFRRLLDVAGIGPTAALSILSSTRYADFRSAVLAEDVAMLTRLKGVGKKLAQRMVLELKEPLEKEIPPGERPDQPGAMDGALREDAASALVTLGFTRAQALLSVERILAREDAPGELGEVVREALRITR